MNFSDASDIRIGQNQISALYFKNRKIWPRNPEEIYLVFTSEEDDNDFYFYARSSQWTLDIEVSYDDGKTWETFTSSIGSSRSGGTYIGTLDTGERMCIRGLNNTYSDFATDYNRYSSFRSDGKFKASGNIMGLIYGKYSDRDGAAFPENTSYNFMGLFMNSKATDISRLKFPAKTLSPYCYGAMFEGCTELVDLYTYMLPATTLANHCYDNMFAGCTNLLEVPILPATTLVEGCYRMMFDSCEKIDYIKMLATDISATDCLEDWVADVAPTGTFVKDYSLTSIPINSVSGIPVGWVYEEVNVPDFRTTHLTIQSQEANNTITYSGSDIEYLYYKVGDEGDTYEDFPSTGVTINADEKLILQGELSTVLGTFASTGNFRVYGNIQSLNLLGSTSIACTGGLFKNCTGLTDARYLILPQTTVPASGYVDMFKGCTSLVTAPKIEATQFNSRSLQSMFSGCTSLTTIRPFTIDNYALYVCSQMFADCTSLVMVPEIIINYAGYQTHQYMFTGCTSLIDASRIKMPTDIRDGYAFQHMFDGCTNLKNVPVLPATTLKHNCYNSMFRGCTSLEYAPILPATTLADSCYFQMFSGCQGLKTCPELPATTLAPGCYNAMFYNCISLTDSPYLGATTLVDSCYRYMFNKCYKLDYIECLATDISASNCTYHWVEDVAGSGTFVKDPNMQNWLLDSVDGIPIGWSDPDDWSTAYFNIKPIEYPCKIKFFLRSGTTDTGISYSTDLGTTWNTLSTVTHEHWVNDDVDYYYFDLTLNNGSVSIKSDHWNFRIYCSKDYYARGNIMSLLYEDNFANKTSLKRDNQFGHLFNPYYYFGSFGGDLVRANELYLPATTLTKYCYESMFEVTHINKAPELPATTMQYACYKNMFAHSALVNAPVLPATTLAKYCYYGMFSNCVRLNVAPALPVTTLTDYCYAHMFKGCYALTTTPTLSSTTLAPGCYAYMFAQTKFASSGIRYISQNSLPATTVPNYGYDHMFDGCTNLTLTDTQYNNLLPATTVGGFGYLAMFRGCTGLTKTVKLPATSFGIIGQNYASMFAECTGITTFTGNTMDGETYPVLLPATMLTFSMCYHMFAGCTGLTNSLRAGDTGYVRIFPTEHEITLNDGCFAEMFMGCSSLVYPAGWDPDSNGLPGSCYAKMFYGCKSLLAKCNREAFMGRTEEYPGYSSICEDMFEGYPSTSVQNRYLDLTSL